MAFYQVLASASSGDAVTQSAFSIQEAMAPETESSIYAVQFDPSLVYRLKPLIDLEAGPEDVVLVHYAIGNSRFDEFLKNTSARLILMFHNITPSSEYREIDPDFAELLETGRETLARMADRYEFAITPSHYNADELREMGYSDVRVIPLIVNTKSLVSMQPEWSVANHLNEVVEGPVALYVGQLSPHKRIDALFEAYHVLTTYIDPKVTLIVVGSGRLRRYRDALLTYASELNLARMWATGAVPESHLAAFFRRADLFVTLSSHEGFCAPLVEAMAFDVPIVATRAAAIPETVGEAGLLLPAEPDPITAAEGIHEGLANEQLRKMLIKNGRSRLAELDPEKASSELRSQISAAMSST